MENPTESGFIFLHRRVEQWEWYKDSHTKSLFFHLILRANHKAVRYKGILIERGCFITGRKKLSSETGLTVSQVRTALNKLKSTNEIAIKTTPQGTHIEVLMYNNYQTLANGLANEQPTTSQRLATKKNDKNNKKEKNISTASPDGDHFNFNTLEKITIQQELDIEIFWNTLLGIYKSESDKGLFNKKLVKKQKQIINGFTKDEREKILEWFRKYKSQLEIAGTWVSTFFENNKTIGEVANYFRSIKDVKETKKKDTFAPLSVKFKNNNTNF